MWILPYILASITRVNRQKVDIVWSPLWASNIFRVYEIIFWRREGIKLEGIWSSHDNSSVSFTLEHYLASWEALIRAYFARGLAFKIVRIPDLQLAGYVKTHGSSPYRYAIAFDVATDVNPSVGAGSGSGSVTVTGSNPILNAFGWGPITDVAGITAVSYNAVAMTLLDKNGNNGVNRWSYSYVLMGPATGAHTLAYTAVGADSADVVTMSYSGAAQTGQPDAHAAAKTPSNSTSVAVSVTVITVGCWISAYGGNEAGGGSFTGTNRKFLGGGTTRQCNDSNTTVSTGVNTWTESWSGSAYGWAIAFSFKPFVSAVNSGFFFAAQT